MAVSTTIPEPSNYTYPTGLKLVLLLSSIFLCMFLVALDKLIISTAIPQITNDFSSTDDIGWYGTAYLLTNCAFILVFGKAYTFLNVKTVFLTAVILFEIGSAICGAAPNSLAFIIGRAVAGLGAGGVQSGVIVIIVYAVPLPKRPQYQGLLGAIYGIASVIGPLVGGAFTTNTTWRWCFYLNLPLGGFVLVFVFFLLHISDHPKPKVTFREKVREINVEGLMVLIPGVVCLCLALQWGGFTYKWSNIRIIILLVLASLLLLAFVLIQVWRPERAIVPPHVFAQRSIASGFFVSCCLGAHQTLLLYYLPIWFQVIEGVTAVESGVRLLPQVIALVIASILTGILTSRTGYYTPFLIFGICLSAIGTGLFTTLTVTTSTGQWIGYQILYGWGFGGCVQAPNMAAQTVLPRNEVSVGASIMLFAQTLFGAIFVTIGQNVFDAQLFKRLNDVTNVTSDDIKHAGATGISDLVPPQFHTDALTAYNNSLVVCFQVALVVACICIIGGVSMEWRNVKGSQEATQVSDHAGREYIEMENHGLENHLIHAQAGGK